MEGSFSQEIYDRISSILALPKNTEKKYWDIFDHITGTSIYLVHYIVENIKEIIHTPTYTPADIDLEDSQIILNLRGLILDIEEEWICCKSFGFSGTLTMDQIDQETFEGVDNYGYPRNYPSQFIRFQNFFPGPVIRIWKYKGVVYTSTHKKIMINKSKWGSDESFEKLFIDIFGRGISTIQELDSFIFDTSKETSNYCHAFILSSPKITTDSRINLGNGLLVYLKSFELNHFLPGAFKYYKHHKVVENEIKEWSFFSEFEPESLPSPEEYGTVIKAKYFGLELSNKILFSGYSNISESIISEMDYRIRPGESLIALFPDNSICKICPRSVNWRNVLLNNNYNLYGQFWHNMDYVLKRKKEIPESNADIPKFHGIERLYTYEELFPELGFPDKYELIAFSQKKSLVPDVFESIPKKDTPENAKIFKKRNIAYCTLFAVPYSFMEQAGNFYKNYSDDLKNIESFFSDNVKTLGKAVKSNTLVQDPIFSKDGELNKAGRVIERFMIEAEKFAKTQIENKTNFKYDKKLKTDVEISVKELILNNIKFHIGTEKSSGLYALNKAINKKKAQSEI